MRSIIVAGITGIAFILYLQACQQKPAGPEHKTGFVPIADSKIYYETTGKGDPVLFLHGGFLDHTMWDQQVKALAGSHFVITCDLRGHGATIDGDSNYFMHDGLKALLDTLKITKTTVVGLSVGAAAATEFALAYPQYVNKLVLTVPGMNRWQYPAKEDSILTRNDSLMWRAADTLKDTTLAAQYFIRSWFDGPHRKAAETDTVQRKKALALVIENAKTHHLKYWPRMADSATIPRLHKLKMPVLIVLGEKDNRVIKNISDTIARHVPQTTIAVISGVAHMPNMEKASIYNMAVKEFIEKQ